VPTETSRKTIADRKNLWLWPYSVWWCQLMLHSCCTQVPTSRAAAETALLTFRKAPQPIQACQYILGLHLHWTVINTLPKCCLRTLSEREREREREKHTHTHTPYCLLM
jgi:hypothetical protein